MKATKFVKKYGWDRAKQFVNADSTAHALVFATTGVSFIDLKRLVESHELVERALSDHNKRFKECQIDIHGLKSFVKKNPKIYPKRLKQAIADVESCM